MAASAKAINIKPIQPSAANSLVRRLHYSGKVVPNSQLHLGVFLDGRLEGALQFGPSIDKRKVQGLVPGTAWHDFIELNRMAFSEKLPRNSESRAIAISMRLIRKHYPNIEWVISYADGAQCGDGAIYRASGFLLTGIKENKTILQMPDGSICADITLNTTSGKHGKGAGYWKRNGAKPLDGYQLRYIYFINPEAKKRLAVPILPFSKIEEMGAGMYRGQKRVKQAMADDQSAQRRGGTDPHAPSGSE